MGPRLLRSKPKKMPPYPPRGSVPAKGAERPGDLPVGPGVIAVGTIRDGGSTSRRVRRRGQAALPKYGSAGGFPAKVPPAAPPRPDRPRGGARAPTGPPLGGPWTGTSPVAPPTDEEPHRRRQGAARRGRTLSAWGDRQDRTRGRWRARSRASRDGRRSGRGSDGGVETDGTPPPGGRTGSPGRPIERCRGDREGATPPVILRVAIVLGAAFEKIPDLGYPDLSFYRARRAGAEGNGRPREGKGVSAGRLSTYCDTMISHHRSIVFRRHRVGLDVPSAETTGG
ncbi:MAG: hypothetical protein QOF73_3447 [Thermomicrobiales bacterium]|nr:hypothetical protein [Thermomicrobiales bacterium]